MKWKNYGLWVSLASILYMVFKDFGMQIDLTTWETYVTAIIGFLAALGIISNPDKGKGFFDKIPDTPAEAITQVTEQLQNQNQQPTIQQETPSQNQGNIQHQGYTPQQTVVSQPQEQLNQNIQQEYSPQANYEQNDYQGYQAQQNDTQPPQQNYSAQNELEVEPTQVQPEVNVQSEQYDTAQEQTSNNTSFDRNSIHGMPAPPNEHM